jgi:hypothetical protein
VRQRGRGLRQALGELLHEGLEIRGPAGGDRSVQRLVGLESLHRVAHDLSPCHDVDADREVPRKRALGGGSVRCPGRHVDAVPGADLGADRLAFEFAGRLVHLPRLGAERLQDEDIVRVVVQRQALRAGRGDVRVGLARVAEFDLEVAAESRDRLVEPVEAL